jgi:hypothetical protein
LKQDETGQPLFAKTQKLIGCRPMALPRTTDRTIQDIAADHAPRAIEVLADIMDDDSYEAKDRINAAEKLLNRGHGMPTQALIVAPSVSKARKIAAGMTDEQLQAVIEAKQLPSLRAPQPMITVEPTTTVIEPGAATFRRAAPMYESKHDPLSGDPAGADEFADINTPLDPMLL